MSINGFALLVAAGFAAVVGVVCYAWGYWDGLAAGRKDVRRAWSIYGHVPERRRAPRAAAKGGKH